MQHCYSTEIPEGGGRGNLHSADMALKPQLVEGGGMYTALIWH